MPTPSPNSLVEALLRHKLLEPEQRDIVTRDLQARFPESKALAGELIRRGWLTPFQANLLLQGKGQDLVLGPFILLERANLVCGNTKVTDLTPLKNLPLKTLDCDFNAERDTAILRSIKTLEKINGKPAAEFWKEVDAKK